MSSNETSIRQGLPAVSTITSTVQRGDSNDRRSAASGIGFVGLGRMGTAMAANLATAGHRVIAYVRHAGSHGGRLGNALHALSTLFYRLCMLRCRMPRQAVECEARWSGPP